jgi:hypothetical protein
MNALILWTYDWVPEGPRGFVRDCRLRWACEEADLTYAVRTVPFDGRETNHLPRQPFGQVPFLDDGELKIFESGAGLLHLARKSDKLMPADPVGEAETLQWTIAALNSIEEGPLSATGRRLNHRPAWFSIGADGERPDSPPRRLVRRALGRHPTRRSGAARTFGRFDHGARRQVPHDPHGHEEARRRPGAAGFVTTEKVGRVRTCRLGLRRLEEEAAWIESYRQLWAARFDALDQVVEELKRKEKIDE